MKKIMFAILIISLFLVACVPQPVVEDKQEPIVDEVEEINNVITEPEATKEVVIVPETVEVTEEKVEETKPLTSVKQGRIRDSVTRNNGLTFFKIINIDTFVVSSFNSTTVFTNGQLVNYEVTNKNDVLRVWLAVEEQISGFARPSSYTLNRTSDQDTKVDWTFYEENYNKGRIERFNNNLDGTYRGFIRDLETFRERRFEGVKEKLFVGDIVFYKINPTTGIGFDLVLYESKNG